jgi:hypothetical protein
MRAHFALLAVLIGHFVTDRQCQAGMSYVQAESAVWSSGSIGPDSFSDFSTLATTKPQGLLEITCSGDLGNDTGEVSATSYSSLQFAVNRLSIEVDGAKEVAPLGRTVNSNASTSASDSVHFAIDRPHQFAFQAVGHFLVHTDPSNVPDYRRASLALELTDALGNSVFEFDFAMDHVYFVLTSSGELAAGEYYFNYTMLDEVAFSSAPFTKYSTDSDLSGYLFVAPIPEPSSLAIAVVSSAAFCGFWGSMRSSPVGQAPRLKSKTTARRSTAATS